MYKKASLKCLTRMPALYRLCDCGCIYPADERANETVAECWIKLGFLAQKSKSSFRRADPDHCSMGHSVRSCHKCDNLLMSFRGLWKFVAHRLYRSRCSSADMLFSYNDWEELALQLAHKDSDVHRAAVSAASQPVSPCVLCA